MTTNPSSHSLDRFANGLAASAAAFTWALAEATWFFIVPDVLLTLVACRSIRGALKAGLAAIGGALLGGFILWAAGRVSPETSREWITRVPGIHPVQVERVRAELADHGLGALLLGPTRGVPYKIYAIESGDRRD